MELLWAESDAERRARRAPALAEALGAPVQTDDLTERQEASERAVHRAIARLAPVESAERALWDAVDEDGVFLPPLAVVAGELELLFDEIEYAQSLVPLLRPFAEGDEGIGEQIERVSAVASRTTGATGALTRAMKELRKAWGESEITVPLEEMEAEARRGLLMKRRLRTIDLFQGTHLVALLRTEAHPGPLPVYLPDAARGRLPLGHRMDARLLVQLFPRQVADEPSPLAALALAIARVVRP